MAKKSIKQLVASANEIVDVWTPVQSLEAASNDKAILVDIRDIRELNREGRITDALHVPRGMAEFWFAADSPYHKAKLADESKTYVLFCASGMRSALTARSLVEMGFTNIAHIDGGFTALKDEGATVELPDN